MNKKALLVCYYFPPLGLGGIGRPLNLFKKLPDNGWDCHVLTVKPVAYRGYEPELLECLDTSRIFRSGSRDPQRLLYLLGVREVVAPAIDKSRKVSERFFPDSKVGWAKPAISLGRALCEKHHYSVLISTSPPVSSHLIGMGLSKEFQIPWIADFRDFWSVYRVEETFRSKRLVKKGQQLQEQIRRDASAITVVNSSVADYLGQGEVITNGYDSDFAANWERQPDKERFTLGLLGHLHDARWIEPLLKLLKRFCELYPSLFGKLRLLQVGQVNADWFRRLLRDNRLDLPVDLRMQQGREETVCILSRAHLLYFGITAREGPGFLPGRTFDLIASGRPIIAYAPPEGQIGKLLAPVNGAFCFQDETIDSAVEKLREQVVLFENGSYRFRPLSEYANRFSSNAMARRFASLMDSLS